jgi:hypothetical protein
MPSASASQLYSRVGSSMSKVPTFDTDYLANIIESQNEHTALDFKREQYHREKFQDLLKDVISMGNAEWKGALHAKNLRSPVLFELILTSTRSSESYSRG